MKFPLFKYFVLFGLLLLHTLISSEVQASLELVRSQLLMGDVPVTIKVHTSKQKMKKAYAVMQEAFERARRIEAEVSEFQQTSQTSLLNRMAGKKWIPIGSDLRTLLLLSKVISQQTNGAFDITFGSQNQNASFRDILVNASTSQAYIVQKNIMIGLSGIAKGYLVDQISLILAKNGFNHHLINAGGDLLAKGKWEVGIRNPEGNTNETICTLPLTDQALSSSGLYERGQHIIDPRTKLPVITKLKSVSVIASSAAMSDALATAGFIFGPQETNKILKKLKPATVIFVDHDLSIKTIGNTQFNCTHTLSQASS